MLRGAGGDGDEEAEARMGLQLEEHLAKHAARLAQRREQGADGYAGGAALGPQAREGDSGAPALVDESVVEEEIVAEEPGRGDASALHELGEAEEVEEEALHCGHGDGESEGSGLEQQPARVVQEEEGLGAERASGRGPSPEGRAPDDPLAEEDSDSDEIKEEEDEDLPCDKQWADLREQEQAAAQLLGWASEEVCSEACPAAHIRPGGST